MKEVSYVHLETIGGRKITLELIDVQQERLDGDVVQIVGKSYDIFAVPVRTEDQSVKW